MKLLFTKTKDWVTLSGLAEYLKTMKIWEYELSIIRKYGIRSIPQNNLLWGWLSILWKSEVWYTPDEWLEVFRSQLLQETRKNPKDRRKKIKRLKSTTELSTIEFNDFLEKIRIFSIQELKIALEYPDNFSYTWIEEFWASSVVQTTL